MKALIPSRKRQWWLGSAGLLSLLLAWWLGVEVLGSGQALAARFSPQATFASLFELLGSAQLYENVWVSLKRIVISLLMALLMGVPLGLLIGGSRNLEAATTPAFQFLRMISPLSWMPVVVMLFGIGDAPIYFLLTFAAVWPIILNTSAGVKSIDKQWLQLGASLSATPWETLSRIILPAVFGHVLTGLRLAIGVVWIVLVPCEMLGVTSGLGYFILDTRDRMAYSELMAAIVLIGLIGWLLDASVRYLHRRWG